MKKFMIETSKGQVFGHIDTSKPYHWSDGSVRTDGEITVTQGKEFLDKLYAWEGVQVRSNWLYIELDDGHYGSPEYKIAWLED